MKQILSVDKAPGAGVDLSGIEIPVNLMVGKKVFLKTPNSINSDYFPLSLLRAVLVLGNNEPPQAQVLEELFQKELELRDSTIEELIMNGGGLSLSTPVAIKVKDVVLGSDMHAFITLVNLNLGLGGQYSPGAINFSGAGISVIRGNTRGYAISDILDMIESKALKPFLTLSEAENVMTKSNYASTFSLAKDLISTEGRKVNGRILGSLLYELSFDISNAPAVVTLIIDLCAKAMGWKLPKTSWPVQVDTDLEPPQSEEH